MGISDNKQNKNMYRITEHARERFEERFRNKMEGVEWGDKRSQISKMRELLTESVDNRSFLNNTRFTTDMYEKYGYDKHFKYLCNGDMVFVAIEEPGYWAIVTCYQMDNRNPIVRHKKYHKQVKEIEKTDQTYLDSLDPSVTNIFDYPVCYETPSIRKIR